MVEKLGNPTELPRISTFYCLTNHRLRVEIEDFKIFTNFQPRGE